MNWEDERYVRIYTRDTVTWKLMGWQARCLLPLLLRKVDRVGCLNLDGAGAEGLAALVDIPVEVAEAGFNSLLSRGVAEVRDGVLIFPHFLDAQTAKHSDKARQAESRGRKRDALLNDKASSADSSRDQESRSVTKHHAPGQIVTSGHTPSQSVTPNCTVLSCTEPNPPLPPQSGGAPEKSSHPTEAKTQEPPQLPVLPGIPAQPNDPDKPPKSNRKRDRDKAAWDRATLTATTLLGELSQAIQRVRPGARPLRPTPSNLEQITGRLLEDNTADDIRHVIAVCEARARRDPKALSYFDAVVPFREKNMGMWLAKTVEDSARDGPKPSWKADPTIGTDRGLPSEEDYKRWNG